MDNWRCSQAFFFSMVNLSGLVPIEMSLFKSHEHAIDAEAGYGPMFGAGHNLHISGNANIIMIVTLSSAARFSVPQDRILKHSSRDKNILQ